MQCLLRICGVLAHFTVSLTSFYSSSCNSGGIFSRLGSSTSEKSSYDLQYAAIMPATMLHNAAAAILMKQCLYFVSFVSDF